MKTKLFTLLLFYTCRPALFSQNISEVKDNANSFLDNSVINPCISKHDYYLLEKECQANVLMLGLNNIQGRSQTITMDWPIHAASGFNDCDYYFIGAYVDHDTLIGTYKDFNCGSNTYDGHHGTDIAAWPFGFYKMDNSLVEVVAAAAGTIVQRADGNFDRNCSSNNLTANSIIIQHADGSEALYWHMKNGSVTSKTVGQTVVAGEYLGVVGSSGSASGPHLHFEVWSGSSNTTYNDPFSGTCNSINANSWWNSQKPHTNSEVIKVSVNTTDIVLPGCPNTETPNESNNFLIPFQGPGLPAGYAKFYIFIRDDVFGLTADCKILNPNGSTFSSWVYTSSANSKTYIKGYSKVLPTIPGTYTFQVIYNGKTCSTNFDITQSVDVPAISRLTKFSIHPNPSNGKFEISIEGGKIGSYSFEIKNICGQLIATENIEISTNVFTKSINLPSLPNGIYFMTIVNGVNNLMEKLVINN